MSKVDDSASQATLVDRLVVSRWRFWKVMSTSTVCLRAALAKLA
jgi:hypothetical protein